MRCSKSRQTISKARQDKLNERKAAKKMRMSTEVENFVDDVHLLKKHVRFF
jgi:t-SNARE complex subunit (syntaxin)